MVAGDPRAPEGDPAHPFPPALKDIEIAWIDITPGGEDLDRASVRLAAGILGVRFDTLWQRERRRRQSGRAWTGGASAAALSVIGLLGWKIMKPVDMGECSITPVKYRASGYASVFDTGTAPIDTLGFGYGESWACRLPSNERDYTFHATDLPGRTCFGPNPIELLHIRGNGHDAYLTAIYGATGTGSMEQRASPDKLLDRPSFMSEVGNVVWLAENDLPTLGETAFRELTFKAKNTSPTFRVSDLLTLRAAVCSSR